MLADGRDASLGDMAARLGHVRFTSDSVEKLKNEMTAKSRGTTVEYDFLQCNALWSARGGRPLEIALAMRSPHIKLG
jgi:hypothetical protein